MRKEIMGFIALVMASGCQAYMRVPVEQLQIVGEYEGRCVDRLPRRAYRETLRQINPVTGLTTGICEISHYLHPLDGVKSWLTGDCGGLQSRLDYINPERSEAIDDCLGKS